MTNQEFIRQYIDNTNINKSHQNLIVMGNILYSYGFHYPLLLKVKDIWFVNSRYYSPTTRRHKALAKRLTNARDVYIYHGNFSPYYEYPEEQKIGIIADSLITESNKLDNEMLSLKRHNTARYRKLESRNKEILDTLKLLANSKFKNTKSEQTKRRK